MGYRNDGGHFHPCPDTAEWANHDGITRRDWLAGLAMQGMFSAADRMNKDWPKTEIIADWAYKYADAMINEGEK